MSKYIVVNRNNIAHNAKNPDARRPVFSFHDGAKAVRYDNTIEIWHDGVLVAYFEYNPDKPKSCGASAWLTLVNGEAFMPDPSTFAEVCSI